MAQALPTFGGVERRMFLVTDSLEFWIAPGDSIKFFRPRNSVGVNFPFPTSHSSEVLRFGEFDFFLLQCFLCDLALRNVHGDAQHSFGLAFRGVVELSLRGYPTY